jgi:LCP family protein required for cell wall assembly
MSTKELIKKYIIIVGVIIAIFASIAVAAAIVYYAIGNINDGPLTNFTPPPTSSPSNGGATLPPGVTASPVPVITPSPGNFWGTPPARTTVLVMGTDAVSLNTDINLIVTLDAPNRAIDVISIPRDMRITLSASDVSELRALGRTFVPSSGQMRFGALHNYAGRTHGPRFAQRHLEILFGIQIDHFVILDLSGFRNIVDLVGGIWFDVPEGGMFYEDEFQDLFINIPGGYQLLDGVMAEGLVRYRESYSRNDLDRINVQHAFMREFFTQALNSQVIRNDIGRYLQSVHGMVSRTDVVATDLLRYIRVIEQLNENSIHFHTIPGSESAGGFYSYNPTDGRAFLDGIFNR